MINHISDVIVSSSESIDAFSCPDHIYTRRVWMYYDKQLHPGIHTVLNRTWETLSSDWTITFLTPKNCSQFIDYRQFPQFFSQLDVRHQSDFLRVYLLARYGGLWLDFSTLVTSRQYFVNKLNFLETVCAGFLCFGNPKYKRIIFSTNVMYAPTGSKYAERWFAEVQRMWTVGCLNYIYSVYRSGVTFSPDIFNPYPIAHYYAGITIAGNYVQQKLISRKYPLVMQNISQNQYALWMKCNNNLPQFKQAFLNELDNPQYPITKLFGIHRQYIFNDTGFSRYIPDDRFHSLTIDFHLSSKQSLSVYLWILEMAISIILFLTAMEYS